MVDDPAQIPTPTRALVESAPAPDEPHRLSAGDQLPALRARLVDAADDPLPLALARRIDFRMSPSTGTTDTLAEGHAEVLDADSGRVQYEWDRGETVVDGAHRGVFRVEYAREGALTVPTNAPLTVRIVG